MQEDNTFQNGLRRDQDPQFQPANSCVDARNLLLTAGGHLEQERGPALLHAGPGLPLVGACALGTTEILFATDGTTAEIGVLDGAVYVSILRSALFSLGPRVSATARVDYRGHRLVYFADGLHLRWLDLDAPPTNLPEGLDLLAQTGLPGIRLGSVSGGGSLPTGVYQACVALLSASKNVVAYSAFTPPVPISKQAPGTDRPQLDGAPPQTEASGSITFHLDHLPLEYSYAQLVVATYQGADNQLVLHRLPLVPITAAEQDFTYYSADQHLAPVQLAEVITTAADYDRAQGVLQKDGHLLLCGVGTPAPDAVDWQAIANAIVLGPAIVEVPYTETGSGGSDYKNPLTCATERGYRRGEVYSFCLVPIVNGRALDAYHIPAFQQAYLGQAPPIGAFDTYYSLVQYPAGQGYPASSYGNNPVRHHRMPGVAQEPLLSQATATSCTLRLLGVRLVMPPDFSALPAVLKARISGYYIGVQPRTAAERSILAQGIAQPLVPADSTGSQLMVSPFNGKWPAVYNDPGFNGPGDGRFGAFYSPETAILQDPLGSPDRLEAVSQLHGTGTYVNTQLSDNGSNPRRQKHAHTLLDYWRQDALSAAISVPLQPTSRAYIAAADDYSPSLPEGAATIYTWQQNGYALLQAANRTLTGTEPGFYAGLPANSEDLIYKDLTGVTDRVYFTQENGQQLEQTQSQTGMCSRYLYNLVRDRSHQYGAPAQATYHPVVLLRPDQDATLPFFGGDTFLGKVALQSSTAERLTPDTAGLSFRTMNYYFCESGVNVALRHFLPVGQLTQGTLPYYPKQASLWNPDTGTGVMQYPTGLGHATGYNRQYSFTDTLVPFFPRDRTITPVTAFANRIAYSVQAVEGEQLDAYRVFRANDYHDLPKDKGPLTDLWAWDGSLYAHCRQALYKCFFNEASTQTTSEGEVYLGNGGLFPRPSLPVLALDGGYAGCQHPRASVSSPAGRFFVDQQGRKVYLFNGSLQEISRVGLYDYFRQQLGPELTYAAGYDYAQERYLLSGLPEGDLSWTPRSKAWTSWHDTRPRFSFGTPKRLLLDLFPEGDRSGGLAVAQAGLPLASELTLVANQPPDASKVFDNVVYQASAAPSQVQQQTEEAQTSLQDVVLLTTYGQLPGPNQTLARHNSHQYQLPVGREEHPPGPQSPARLKGKWLRATTRWAAAAVPVLIRQISVLFRPTYR